MAACYIVGAGDFTPRDFQPGKDDFVIAADGGLRPLIALGCTPDLIIGDLDSWGQEPLPEAVALKRLPVEKDDTDTGIALEHGFDLGYRDFRLYGCGGGRIDHLLANFQTMARFSRMGAALRLVDPEYDAYTLTDGCFALPDRPAGCTVSVFCCGAAASGVTLEGLKYPLQNVQLTCELPGGLGVSNEHLGGTASVAVASGTLLVIQYLQSRA